MPASNKPKMLLNFSGVVDTGNASLASYNDTGNAVIPGVIETGDAPLESLTVRQ
jgi:hypothetical protein